MNPNKPEKYQRIAQPGDLFILLVPDQDDQQRLQSWQDDLQARYGGQQIQPIHVTAARFTPQNGLGWRDCAQPLRAILRQQSSLELQTDALVQFFAPYWQSLVLRWRVAATPPWRRFRSNLELGLANIGCPSHFERRRHATCTALTLEQEVDLNAQPPERDLPTRLFTAQIIWMSLLEPDGQFSLIDEVQLPNRKHAKE